MVNDVHPILHRIASRLGREGDELLLAGAPSAGGPKRVSLSDRHGGSLLARYLYACHYACDPALADPSGLDPLLLMGMRPADPAFLAVLRSSNPGRGYLDAGWEVREALGRERFRVQKNGISLVIERGIHFFSGQDTRPGATIGIRFPAESVAASPGFYVVFSDAGPAAGAELIRVYLNLERTAVVSTVRRLLAELFAQNVPFTAKILAELTSRRRDNCVLYCAPADLRTVLAIVAACHARRPLAFRRSVPGLTHPILPGVAVAEDPEGRPPLHQSFGEHRCGLIAESILATASSGRLDRSTVERDIASRFASHGIDARRPCSHSPEARALFSSLPKDLGSAVTGSETADV